MPDSTLLDGETYSMNGVLFTPMQESGDTLKASIDIPKGSSLEFMFWITENTNGDFVDIWDKSHPSYQTSETNHDPIRVNAHLNSVDEDRGYNLLEDGWIIGLVVLILFVISSFKLIPRKSSYPYFQHVIFFGLALYIYHFIIRCGILDVGILHLISHPSSIPEVLRASMSDLAYITGITALFACLLYFVRKPKWSDLIYYCYIAIALFSLAAALLNIKTVHYLGKPFTYQWLYYSDFLGSTEARQVFQTNGSLTMLLNILGLCISSILLARILLWLNDRLQHSAFSKLRWILPLTILATLFLSFAPQVKLVAREGKTENPITAFVASFMTTRSQSSFFSMPLTDSSFSPKHGFPVTNPISIDSTVKNVLLIVLESAGAEYIDLYGGQYNLTPNLNEYSKNSYLFENAYAHAPATNKSMVSLLCSIYPWVSYLTLTQEYPKLNFPSLSSVLSKAGYRTSFFSSSDLGFQQIGTFLSNRKFDIVEDYKNIPCNEEFTMLGDNYDHGNGIDDFCLANRVSNWIAQDTATPFFSVLWTVQGHYPYFISGEEKNYGVNNPNLNRYLNALHRNDEMIGEIMQHLKNEGLDSNTLVVVLGDHGETFGKHHQHGHGSNIYEENLRIPLLFINPVLFNGERSQQLAGIKDVPSTILGILNSSTPAEWQGRNLLTSESYEIFFFAPWSGYRFGYRHRSRKYIFDETVSSSEVYNLQIDPSEGQNLEADLGNGIAQARKAIGEWVQYQQKFVDSILK